MKSKEVKLLHIEFYELYLKRDNKVQASADANETSDIDHQLLAMIRECLLDDVPLSDAMNKWTPHSQTLQKVIDENKDISSEDGLITVKEALVQKQIKQKKFRRVQNLSMLACTVLLLMYFAIVTWVL